MSQEELERSVNATEEEVNYTNVAEWNNFLEENLVTSLTIIIVAYYQGHRKKNHLYLTHSCKTNKLLNKQNVMHS
ncbi:hypothetical protein DFR86_05085 [Acidianus sulfidivorans JP7]|uniref:Uncharacterized protein n=1 Tax=Acidianus sulfidivorans JP7 TaxID=619593 RepID=A0A2U9IM53_9CREN|nr:hypothetical protein [Acidianus sulfidivorans]AWR96994.1 hypothetical protein DFR86_05085 [Acidianus sulfidivorans JP7]